MEHVILVIHVLLALGIVGAVLLQPPESGSLGGLGASNTMSGQNVRGQGNVLTRTTAILATLFIITSLALALIGGHRNQKTSILDEAAPVTATQKKTETPKDTTPSVPLSN